jgi:hypothetical protein
MKRSAKTYPVVLGVLLGATIVAAALWFTLPRSSAVYTDADTIRATKEVAKLRDVLWQPPEWLGDGLNTDYDEYEPALSPDGLTLLFVRGRPGEGADIFQSIRTPDGWSEPEPVDSINTVYDDLGPAFTSDGDGLYFYSDRPGSVGGYDIWFVDRTGHGWGEPYVLGPNVNSVYNDYGPSISPDSSRFYFASNRPRDAEHVLPDSSGRWPATVRESFQNLPYDIYSSKINDRGMSGALLVEELSSAFSDGAPEVSPVNDFVYLASDRPGGEGGFDLYRSRLVNGEFFPIEHLGDGVNTEHNELDPTLGMGGFGLAFSSDRVDGADSDRDYNLYRTQSREVYRDVEVLAARMSFLDFLKIVVPWILLLLALLGLLALLRKFTTDDRWKARWRKLGLLAKCLIVSGLVHMLLLALLTIWQVSNNLDGLFNSTGGSKVTLVSSSVGGGAISQIRGEVASSVESEALKLTVNQAAMELTQVPRFDSALQSDLAPTEVNDQVQSAEIRLARTEPTRQETTIDSQDALQISNDIPVDLPASAQRAAVSEQHPSSDSAQASSQPTPTYADVQLASSSHVASGSLSLQPSDMQTDSIETVNPVSIAEHSEPAHRQSIEPTVPEIATAESFANDGVLPELTIRGRDSVEVALQVSPSLMANDTSAAAIEVGGSEQNALMSEVRLTVRDERVDSALTLNGSRAARQYEPADLDQLGLGETETDFELPGEVAREISESTEEVIDVDEVAAEYEELGNADIALQDSNYSELDSEGLTEEALDSTSFEDSVKNVAAYQSSSDSTRHGFNLQDVGVLELDLSLPSSIEAPEQVAIERHFSGVVVDAVTDQPVPNALVKIDSDLGGLVETRTGDDGTFVLRPEFEADFVAVTASLEGYSPSALNLPIAQLEEGVVREIRLEPIRHSVISIEENPEVHHLGNNAFGGRINSQFQKDSEGTVFQAEFTVDKDQLAMLDEIAGVTLLAKGLQTNNLIRINGNRLSKRLNDSPSDGSFGRFAAPFPAHWLVEGVNTVEIESRVSSGSDYDDFEIVNVQIMLAPPEDPARPARRRLRNTL